MVVVVVVCSRGGWGGKGGIVVEEGEDCARSFGHENEAKKGYVEPAEMHKDGRYK